jgi:hypothetical protein
VICDYCARRRLGRPYRINDLHPCPMNDQVLGECGHVLAGGGRRMMSVGNSGPCRKRGLRPSKNLRRPFLGWSERGPRRRSRVPYPALRWGSK